MVLRMRALTKWLMWAYLGVTISMITPAAEHLDEADLGGEHRLLELGGNGGAVHHHLHTVLHLVLGFLRLFSWWHSDRKREWGIPHCPPSHSWLSPPFFRGGIKRKKERVGDTIPSSISFFVFSGPFRGGLQRERENEKHARAYMLPTR